MAGAREALYRNCLRKCAQRSDQDFLALAPGDVEPAGSRAALMFGVRSPTPGSPAGQPGWGGAVREGLVQWRALAYARASDTSSGHNHSRTIPITHRQAATTAHITIQNFQ